MNGVTVVGVPMVEGAVPILFLAGASRAAAALSLALLAVFSMAVLRARRLQGNRVPCGCFGRATTRDYRVTVVRNSLLGLAAALVPLAGRDVALFSGIGAPRSTELLAVLLSGVGVALIAWMLWSVTTSLRGGR